MKSHQFVIVPKTDAHHVGIAIETVYDVVRTELTLDSGTVKVDGIAGSAILNRRMTLIVDLPGLLEAAARR